MRYIQALLLFLSFSSLSFAWWDASYTYRMPLNITNGGSNLTDYQVPVNITNLAYNSTAPVGSWHFSEGSGTRAADSSGNGNDGTLANTPIWVPGKFGGGLQFNGVNNYVERASGVSGIGGGSQITYAAWIKRNSLGATNALIYRLGSTALYNYQLLYIYGNQIILDIGNDANNNLRRLTTTNTLTDTASFHYIVATYDAGTIHIYVDGAEWAGTYTPAYTWAGNVVSNVLPLRIGENFNGTIDELRIYNRSLSAQEIADLYNAQKARLDYADLRFALANDTQIPFWLESDKTAWVKIPSLPAGASTVYAYYGNPAATSASNGTNTFDFFDDFNDNSQNTSWANLFSASGTVTEQNQQLETTVPGGGWKYTGVVLNGKTWTANSGVSIRLRIKQSAATANTLTSLFFTPDNTTGNSDTISNDLDIRAWPTQYLAVYRKNAGTQAQVWSDTSNPGTTWHTVQMDIDSNNVVFTYDGVQKFSGAHGINWGANSSHLRLQTWGYDAFTGYYDDVRVRKYSSPEPTAGPPGTEQQTDTTAPSVSIQSPTSQTYNTSTLNVNFTAADNTGVSSCTVRLNGTVNSSTCSNYSLALANGAYSLNVSANDTTGNANSSQVSFTVAVSTGQQSSSSPQISTISGIADGNVSFSFTPAALRLKAGAQEYPQKPLKASVNVNKVQIMTRVAAGGQNAPDGTKVTYTISE